MQIRLTVNKKQELVEVDEDTPLLWTLREELGLQGPKFGCGKALCGACTVHVNGAPVRSCLFPASAAQNQEITTIEGLPSAAGTLHPVQQAWLELNVPQCGYCQCGQIMSAVALLREHPKPSDSDIDAAMDGNLCRCGTYQRIRAAIHRAAELVAGSKP